VRDVLGHRGGLGLGRARQRVVHEQHVGVAAVALLAAPEPPHGDHRQADVERRASLRLDLARRGRQGRGDDGGRDVRQRPPDAAAVGQVEQVGAGDAQQLLPAQAAGRDDGGLPVLAPPHGGHERAGEASRCRGASSSSEASMRTAPGARPSSPAT
jgi:hypothetical protein